MFHDRPSRLAALAWALIALLPARALPAAAFSMAELSAADAGPSDGAPLDLVVNGGSPRAIRAVLRGGDVLVPVEDLAAGGLSGFAGAREVIHGREHVSLRSLEPRLRFELDERALAVRVIAGAELLGTSSLDLRPTRRPPGLEVRGDASGFVNYSLQLRSPDRRASGFAEAGASEGGRLLYASGQLLSDGAAVRGLTSLTFDDVPGLRRLVLGDAFASSGGLGGGVLLGGVSLVREYGLDPYFVRSPMPRLSGFASTPSTLDVYVNGVLTRQVPLAAGGYDVTNLPVSTGAGNVQTVLRDAFGRTEVLSWQYYYTSGLLARGLTDYGWALGLRRLEYGRRSAGYGRPLLTGRHRVGLTDDVTLGGRIDAAADLVSGGPSATLGLPFGSLELEAAASRQGRNPGAAASAGYSFVSRRFGAGALLRAMSDGYAHAALRAADDRARVQSSLFAGVPIASRVTAGASYTVSGLRDAGLSDTLSLRTDVSLGAGFTVGVSGTRTRLPGRAPALDAFATLSWAFAPMSMADVSVQGGDGGRTLSAGAQRGLPAGTGLGYRARTGSGPLGDAATGVLQYQWDYGRYEVEYDRIAGNDSGVATVAGGAVFVGDRLFLSRPVQEGFGLIRVGVPGIRGFAEGQEIGRTDSRGDLLVPSLLPYYGNRLGIADRDIPIEYRIGATELLAAPALRGGVVTRFAVTPLRFVEGELVVEANARELPPAYGDVTVRAAGGPFSSPVGGDGRFYLEALPPGTHQASVEWSGGRCVAALVLPEEPRVVDLGKVSCRPEVIATATSGAPAGQPSHPRDLAPARVERDQGSTSTSTPTPQSTPPVVGAAVPPERSASAEAEAPSRRAPPASANAQTRPSRAASPTRRIGLGPASDRCPACAVCFLAQLDRLRASRYTLSCVRDLALMQPARTRSEAARTCIQSPDYAELCAECREIRSSRTCPSWPAEAPKRAASRGGGRGNARPSRADGGPGASGGGLSAGLMR